VTEKVPPGYPPVEPEEGDDPSDPVEDLREQLQEPADGEEPELIPDEREQRRQATTRIQDVLNLRIQSVFSDITRTGAFSKFTADMNRFARLNLPDSIFKGVVGKTLPSTTLSKLLSSIAVGSPWLKQMQFINSDVYKLRGIGQSNLSSLSDLLVKNLDFRFDKTAAKLAAQFAERQSSWLKTIGPTLAKLKSSFYPDNLLAIEDLEFEEVEEVVMLDGIALYGVPRTELCEKLIRAETTSARRDILGRRWKAISADCRTAVAGCDSATVAPYVSFVIAALDALDAENPKAAQAMAASVLDTVVNGYFGNERYKLTPNNKTKGTTEFEKFTLKEFIAFAPLWQAYQKYKTKDRDAVPSTFSRHATVHGVSQRQFSRRNAVQAVLFVSSLLLFLDEEASFVEVA
jgi:hypothetical protein